MNVSSLYLVLYKILLLPLLILLLQEVDVVVSQYQTWPSGTCLLGLQPIVLLAKNRTTQEFHVVKSFPYDTNINKLQSTEQSGQYRYRRQLLLLESEDIISTAISNSNTILYNEDNSRSLRSLSTLMIIPGLTISHHNHCNRRARTTTNSSTNNSINDLYFGMSDSNRNNNDEILGNDYESEELLDYYYYYARECNCFNKYDYPTVYCPFAATTCNRPHTYLANKTLFVPGCLNRPQSNDTIKNIFQIAMVWFLLWFTFLCFTNQGRSSIDFIIHKCCYPRWNYIVANRLLRHERNRDRANLMIRDYILRQRTFIEQQVMEAMILEVTNDNDNNNNNNTNNENEGEEDNGDGGSEGGNETASSTPGAVMASVRQQVQEATTTNNNNNDGDDENNRNQQQQQQQQPTKLLLRTRIFHHCHSKQQQQQQQRNDDCAARKKLHQMKEESSNDDHHKNDDDDINDDGIQLQHFSSSSPSSTKTVDEDVKNIDMAEGTSLQTDDDDNNDNDDDYDDDDDEDEVCCTICFVPLEDGDRIGSINCPHLFHVECLKIWLKRRNTCPICQKQNIATPEI